MLSVLEARVNVCVEASHSVGSNFLFLAGLTLKENHRSRKLREIRVCRFLLRKAPSSTPRSVFASSGLFLFGRAGRLPGVSPKTRYIIYIYIYINICLE